jgi:protein-tyrosine phosphatase
VPPPSSLQFTMHPQVFWIDRIGAGLVGIMPRPRGGDWLDGEIRSLAEAGVNVLVSLLTADEVAELELQDEERLCDDCGVRFISFPIQDRGVPFSISDARRTIGLILTELRAGKTVAVHCRMGIGRSALVAACLLKSQGIGVDEAFAMISRARGFSVPDTDEQKVWVKGFGEVRDGRRAEGLP